MSKRPFNIIARDDAGIQQAIRILQNTKISPEHPLELIIQPYKRNRSQEQNRLMWSWINMLSNDLGDTPEAIHEDLKRRFLKKLLERENETFRDSLDKLRKAYLDGHHELAVQLERFVMDQASTSMLNTKQFTEYLELILEHAKSLNINLPLPADRKKL